MVQQRGVRDGCDKSEMKTKKKRENKRGTREFLKQGKRKNVVIKCDMTKVIN